MSHPPKKNTKNKKRAVLIVLSASIAVHLLAGGVLAVIKITEVLQKEAEFEAPLLEPVEPPPPPPPPPPTTSRTQKSMPRPQPLAAQNPQDMDVPSIAIDKSNLNMLSGRGMGGGLGQIGGGVMDSLRSIELFGTEVATGGIGLVLDVSGSAHAYLDAAIEEIDRHFPDQPMVLVVGCGMSDGSLEGRMKKNMVPGEPRIVPYGRRGKNEKYDKLWRSVHSQLEDFFADMRKKSKEAEKEMRAYFDDRDNLYMLYGGDIWATNFAFEHVLEQNVDTIYWFADFADDIDGKIINDLTRELRSARVKVIAHNFFGKPVRDDVRAMVKKTGGQTIEVVPGTR